MRRLRIWYARDGQSHAFAGFLLADADCIDRPYCFVNGTLGDHAHAGSRALAKDVQADPSMICRKITLGYGMREGAIVDLRHLSHRNNQQPIPAWLLAFEYQPLDNPQVGFDICRPFHLETFYKMASVAGVAVVETEERGGGEDARLLMAAPTQKPMILKLEFGSTTAAPMEDCGIGEGEARLIVGPGTTPGRLLELLSQAYQTAFSMWPFFARGEALDCESDVPTPRKKEAAKTCTLDSSPASNRIAESSVNAA